MPIRPELFPVLDEYLQSLPDEGAEQLVFPWWNGEDEELARVSSRLSNCFATLFAYSGCEGISEHDLCHEATCRWFELRNPKTGDWLFRDVEIHKIMGWVPGSKMAQRYASFRAEDLAARM